MKAFYGDLEDYQSYLLEVARRQRESLRADANAAREQARNAPAPQPVAAAPVNVKALQRELQKTEAAMATAQAERAQCEARLLEPLSASERADVGKRLKALTAQVEELEERWLQLGHEIEQA